MTTATRLQDKIKKEINPKLLESLSIKNKHALPQINKVTVAVGIRSDVKDTKVIDAIMEDLKTITGQQAVRTVAKKSISSFGVREGQTVGAMVTLRGKRMYDFLEKLVGATLPRVRDFRGLSAGAFDKQGNYSIGLRDQIPFPEISADSIKHHFGLQVTISVKAQDQQSGKALLQAMGFPLKK